MTQSPSIFRDNKPPHAKMASYSLVLEMSTRQNRRRRGSSSSTSNRNTSRRCTFKYFTKTGIFLILLMILMALPSRSFCRPVENSDYVYAPDHADPEDVSGEEGQAHRFEFSRKIISTSSQLNDRPAPEREESSNVHSLSNNDNDDPLLNNSSMIVHVIVTSSSSSSSSSTSSSELETDSDLQEVPQESLQYTIDDDEEVEEVLKSSTPKTQENPPNSQISEFEDSTSLHRELELQKLPKSQEKHEPVQDIFSAFYRAFSQPSSSALTASQDETFQIPTEETITTFMIRPQPKRQRQNFNLYPSHRRRGYRQQERRKLESAPAPKDDSSGSIIMMMMGDEPAAPEANVSVVAERLEQLAKKIDKSDQEAGQLQPSSSKVAVSVAVTHSKSVVHGGNKNKSEEVRNAQSESPFGTIHDSSSSPTRTRPLIKSLPRNDDNRREKTHNYTRHSFEKPGSTNYGDREDAEESEIDFRISKDRNNIIPLRRIAEDSPDQRYGLPQGFQSSSSYPKAEPSSFIEITTYRPLQHQQRRKIARTVSGQIGDPSSSNLPEFLFNLNVPFHSTTQQPSTTTFKSWQQPEKVWSEPARVWGEPAKVWGEPERIWSEPAKFWSEPEKVWGNTKRQHEKQQEEDEQMQSDQPQPPPQQQNIKEDKTNQNEDDPSPPRGTFVILGDDENEGDSIDGDLGRPLMLHHFTIPQQPQTKPKETVITSSSISTSVSSSTSSNSGSYSRKVSYFHSQPLSTPQSQPKNDDNSDEDTNSSVNQRSTNSNNTSDENEDGSKKKSGKKFGYVIEGANVRKYRVEERTPDGFIVGEYGVLNNQNAFLRGVRYTADGTINPRLIHEALMKFLSLRRRRR